MEVAKVEFGFPTPVKIGSMAEGAGIVLDEAGRGIENASATIVIDGKDITTLTSGPDGRFTFQLVIGLPSAGLHKIHARSNTIKSDEITFHARN